MQATSSRNTSVGWTQRLLLSRLSVRNSSERNAVPSPREHMALCISNTAEYTGYLEGVFQTVARHEDRMDEWT